MKVLFEMAIVPNPQTAWPVDVEALYSHAMPSKSEWNDVAARLAAVEKQQQKTPLLQSAPPATGLQGWLGRNNIVAGLLIAFVAAVVTAFGTYFGFITHLEADTSLIVKNQVNESLKDEHGRMDQMSSDIGEIKGELKVLLQAQVPRVVKESALLPADKFAERMPELRASLHLAKTQKVAIDEKTIKQVGDKLVQARRTANDQGEVWDTYAELISYRSFLNGQLDPNFQKYRSTGEPKPHPPPYPLPGIYAYYYSNVWTNAVVDLDGRSWENEVFKNSVIRYHGGPVMLKNVKFENCRFEISQSPPGEKLGDAILAANAVSFEHAG